MSQPIAPLFPFSYFDLMCRRWMRARYVASLDNIAERYGCFRIEGPPELRTNAGSGFEPPQGDLTRS